MQRTTTRTNARAEVRNRLRRKRNQGTSRGRGPFLDARNRFLSSLDGCLLSPVTPFITSCHLLIIPLLLATSFLPAETLSVRCMYVTNVGGFSKFFTRRVEWFVPLAVLEGYRVHKALVRRTRATTRTKITTPNFFQILILICTKSQIFF